MCARTSPLPPTEIIFQKDALPRLAWSAPEAVLKLWLALGFGDCSLFCEVSSLGTMNTLNLSTGEAPLPASVFQECCLLTATFVLF